MNHEELDEWLRETAAEVRVPPPVPREAIWAAIQADREADELRRRRIRFRFVRRVGWGAGIAALLLVGVGLGRYSIGTDLDQGAGSALSVAAADGPGDSAYRLVTARHLSQAEALLTLTRSASEASDLDRQTVVWAKDLLTTTRLLLDSPGGADPRLRSLLQDLELVLAEISQLPGGSASPAQADEELMLLKKSMDHAGVLPRIRTAIPAGAVQVAS